MKKRLRSGAIIAPGIIIFLAIAYWIGVKTQPPASPQQQAQDSVKLTQGMINAHLGQSYHSISFGKVQPVYLSDQDSTVIGYMIDHDFSTVRHPSYSQISHKRYYLGPKYYVVNQQNHYPEAGMVADDEKGISAIREAVEKGE